MMTKPTEDLTPGNIAMLDQNWRAANDELDDLLRQVREHKDQHCAARFCGSPEFVAQLDTYKLHHVHMMLRVAMERLVCDDS